LSLLILSLSICTTLLVMIAAGAAITATVALVGAVALPTASAATNSYIVVDSRDWHDLYLGSVYAGLTNQSFLSFASLGDAQIKSKLISAQSQVTILEPSKNPVVKKYASYLAANGISQTNTISYDDYTELQFDLLHLLDITPNQPINGYTIIYAPFGVEAVVISPVLMRAEFMPLFVDETTASDFFDAAASIKNRPTILVGHMPIRLVSDLQNAPAFNIKEQYVGEMENNSAQIIADMTNPALANKIIGSSADVKMGIISRIDRIDLQSLMRGIPQFVYAGSAKDVADQIAGTNILVFEVISSDAADLAKSISALSGKNLKLLVKYAQGFTNIQGLAGQLLDLDTVSFPYPYTLVSVQKATYYPQESTVGITFTNSGNVPALAYSTIEFGQSTYADDQDVIIPAQTTLTIPYVVDSAPSSMQVVVNTLYGRFAPLTQSIVSSDGQPLVILNATTDQTADASNISFVDSRIDETNGVLQLDVQNNNVQAQALVSTQVIIDNVTLVSSSPAKIEGGQTGRIDIPIPYLSAQDIINKPMKIIFSFGEKDTIKVQSADIQVTQVIYTKRATSHVLLISIVIIIIIVLLTIFFIYLRKKRA